jgi:hypothetical protein
VKRAIVIYLLAFMTAGAAPAPIGTFGNVFVHPETGDLLGIELAFLPATGEVEIVMCEGGCSYVERAPYAFSNGACLFTYRDATLPVTPMEVRWRGRNLIISSPKSALVPPTVLKPLRKPFGLVIAKGRPKP